ncbi:MAG: zinc-ribbon domain-containing protein [Eubacteriales bacterium]|nr:zinc-ribbon domain-containing protein [Eubacteriales bacterium]
MRCPACGNQVSSNATTCPQCGHPLKKGGGGLTFWGVVGAIIVAVIIISVVG